MYLAFDHIVGNDHAKKYLTNIFTRNRVPQSLLFSGPDGIGKSLFAAAFGRLILGDSGTSSVSHDYHEYRPEGKVGMHSMDSIRSFSQEVFVPPYTSQKKVLVVHDADRMLTYSANALLKAFEEPAPHTVIILLSRSPESLLPTIRSRCYQIRFQPLTKQEIVRVLVQQQKKSAEEAKEIAERSQGSIGVALQLVEKSEEEKHLKQVILDFLSCGPSFYYPHLLDVAKELGELMEKDQKPLEEKLRQEVDEKYPGGVSSVQQHAFDQEIAGALALHAARKMDVLFDLIVAWYRDLHLLQVNGEGIHLYHKEYTEQLVQVMQRGNLRPLDNLLHSISDARLAFARFMPLPLILENLFL